MDVRRFRGDLYSLAAKACAEDGTQVRARVLSIADVLVGMYKKNLVKINHSALELVCARWLIRRGYDVKVEHKLDRGLVCDLMGTRRDGTMIVEIETGFIPPEAALEPSAYARSRISSKIARYSRFATRFALGTTPSYVLDFSRFFLTPTRERSVVEASRIKGLTDVRYNKPPISIEELMLAKLHSVMIIDVDSGETDEVDPVDYLESSLEFGRRQGPNHRRTSTERGLDFGASELREAGS